MTIGAFSNLNDSVVREHKDCTLPLTARTDPAAVTPPRGFLHGKHLQASSKQQRLPQVTASNLREGDLEIFH